MKNVDESDREIVAKYLTQWDQQVNERFRAKDEEYKPWKELGDYDAVMESLGYIQLLNDHPEVFYERLGELLKEQGTMPGDLNLEPSNLPEYDGIPQEFVEELQNLRKQVGSQSELTATLLERQEQEQLDKWTQQLHTEQGAFDDRWVHNYLAENPKSTGKDAVDAFRTMLGEYGTPTKVEKEIPPGVKIPVGTGSIIPEQVDLTKLSKAEQLDLMVKALERSKEG